MPANGVWAITLSPPSTSGGFHLSALQLSPVYGSLWGTSPAIHLFAAEPAPLCAAGTYGEYGREPCTAASPGHFVGGNGRTTQDACNFGTYQPQEGQASCLPAPAGSYVWTTGATSAALCGVGTFQNLTGQNYCGPAPAGSYVDTIGAATATLCPAGTYSPEFVDLNSRVGAITCTPAPAGAYIPNPGSTAYYHLCAAGTYSTGGAAACTPAPVDTYVPDYAGVAAIACPAGTGTNGLTGQTACTPIVIVIAPPFSLPGSLPDAAACLCLPPYMVQDPFTTHHWWARAGGGGALLIEPFAIGVNPAETGTLTVKVYDPSNVLVGTSTGAHPAGGESPLPPVTVGAPVPGGLYHVTIQVAGGAPQARHYRLELHGATLLGMNSPSQAQPEHDPARWIVNVVAGEPIDVRVDTGVEAGATAAVVNLYSPSGVLIATGGLGVALGTGPAAIGGQWVVEVITGPGLSVGHYLITRNSGSDRGIYVDWLTFGHGALTVSLIRNGVPNALPVTVDVVDVLTNAVVATQVGVLGAANFTDLPVGNYRVRITGPDNVSVDTFVTCDGVTPITITLPNRPPKAVADTATTPEDTAVTIPVLTNDSDSDGGTLSVASATQGAHGSVAVNGDGTVTYTPAPNWNGTDTFTYTVSDGQGGTATATVAVTVTPVNDQPVAVDDSATTPEDTAVTVSVLGNDSDVDGDTLTVTSVTQGANGTVAIVGSQAVYTPASNWSGTDTFTYTIVDGNGGTGTATVTVTVTSVNDPPAAANDTATTPEDTAVTILVLTNDSDSDGGTLSVASAAQGAHGSVVVNGDGTVTYTPASNWNGADTFSYTIDDGQGGTATATVTVTVTPVNDQPVAVGDSATTPEDTAVTTNVTSNDSDVDGDTLSVTGVTQGANGTVAIVGNQAIYTPASNWSGTDTFTYTIVDGHGGTATATVTVTVTPVNDLPTAVNDSATTNAVTAIAIPVLANDSDGDGGTLSVVSASTPANGAVVVNPSGTVTYTSTAAFSGTDTFTYTVSDGQGGTATATVTVTVKASAGPGCSDKPKDGKSDDDHQSKDGKKGGRESTEDRDRDCPRSEPRMTGGGTIEQPGSQGSQSKDDDKSKGSQSKDDGKSKGGQSSANCQSKDDGKSKGGQSSTDCKSKDDGKSKGSQSSNDDDKSKSGQSKDENKSKRWTWGFEIRCDGSKANLEYQDHTGGNFHLESVTSVVCTDDPAVNPTPPQAGFDTLHLIGVGRWNGVSGHTVDVTFVDAGEPGTRDSIVLTVKTAGGAVVSTVSGKLSGGNHQAHK